MMKKTKSSTFTTPVSFWKAWKASAWSYLARESPWNKDLLIVGTPQYMELKQGTLRFETLINRFLDLAKYLFKEMSSREKFELVFDDEIGPKIKAQMIEEGMTMVSYQPQSNKANFFRTVFSNPATRKTDVNFPLEETERLGKDM